MRLSRALPMVLVSLAGAPAVAQTVVFTSNMTSAQVVPPTASNGVGSGYLIMDREANTLAYRMTMRKLMGNETAAHIHGFAPAGQNAGELLTLPPGLTKEGVWTFPESVEDMLVAGDWYIDVHTDAFPAGEVRAQGVRRADDAVLSVLLDRKASQGSNSPATGTAFMRVDRLINELRFNVVMEGLTSTELQSHIHKGAPGLTGPILYMFNTGNQKTGKYVFAEPDEFALLHAGTYMNVHTQNFLMGEIRGQLEPAGTNPSAYCDGKRTAGGCTPVATWSGTPTTTGPDDLTVSAVRMPNQVGAHFFWGVAPKRSPFFGGTLCVRGPLVRAPLAPTGGTAGAPASDCSGAPSVHLSQAYLAQQGLTPGTLVYGQWWTLEPGSAGKAAVGLSNAVQIEVRP